MAQAQWVVRFPVEVVACEVAGVPQPQLSDRLVPLPGCPLAVGELTQAPQLQATLHDTSRHERLSGSRRLGSATVHMESGLADSHDVYS